MTPEELRHYVADQMLSLPDRIWTREFINEVRSGERDGSPWVLAASWVNDAWLKQVQPAPELVED